MWTLFGGGSSCDFSRNTSSLKQNLWRRTACEISMKILKANLGGGGGGGCGDDEKTGFEQRWLNQAQDFGDLKEKQSR